MEEHLLLDYIIRFEDDELKPNETIDLFSHLIKNNMLGSLQGFYGRFAERLIEQGYLDSDGDILKYHKDEVV